MKPSEYLEGKDFSLVLGGPFFQLLNRVHLTGKALELVKVRTLVLSMLAWLPLMLLSILNGQAWGEGTNLPFIEDIEVHIRFLVALPLMVFAELMVHQRMRLVVAQFEGYNLIPESAKVQFHNAIGSAFKLRDSILAEVIIVILIYVIGYNLVWNKSMALDTTAWYSEPDGSPSLAGVWFRYVSLPIFQFLFLRWYYRIFIWTRFLFQVSRIRLNLVPTHPDYMGGLGFLSNIVFAFMPLAVVHGAVLSGMISNHIFHDGAALLDFKIEIGIMVLVVLCLVILPLFFFSSQLSDTKRTGSIEYGRLAAGYVQAFDHHWVKGNQKVNDPLKQTQDIQGLADLGNSYQVIEQMKFIPITRTNLIMLVAGTVAPVLPLVLTMMPLSELLKMLSGLLF